LPYLGAHVYKFKFSLETFNVFWLMCITITIITSDSCKPVVAAVEDIGIGTIYII